MAKRADVQHLVQQLRQKGFSFDSRSRNAYKLPGHEGMRVDIASRSWRLEFKNGDTWAGASETHYFGEATPDFSAAWAEWARKRVEGTRGPEPKLQKSEKQKAAQKKAELSRAAEHARTHGAGFYVTNGRTTSSLMSGRARLADHPLPFATLEEAIDHAKGRYHHFMSLSLHYLLPVEVVEARSREQAERGEGHVWWTDGKRRGPAVAAEQLGLQGISRGLRDIVRSLREGFGSARAAQECKDMRRLLLEARGSGAMGVVRGQGGPWKVVRGNGRLSEADILCSSGGMFYIGNWRWMAGDRPEILPIDDVIRQQR
jgi:hypothetical protein